MRPRDRETAGAMEREKQEKGTKTAPIEARTKKKRSGAHHSFKVVVGLLRIALFQKDVPPLHTGLGMHKKTFGKEVMRHEARRT